MQLVFLIHTELRCTGNHTSGLRFILCEPTESAKGTDQKQITSLYISRLTDCSLKYDKENMLVATISASSYYNKTKYLH